jgi:hypothetical protein
MTKMELTQLDPQRLIAYYEIMKLILNVKGSIVELGVGGAGFFSGIIRLSNMLEPYNATRRFVGFDTFSGFPSTSEHDDNPVKKPERGECSFPPTVDDILELTGAKNLWNFVHDSPRVELVTGDILDTVPNYIEGSEELGIPPHRHLLVALLHLDCDLYEPTLCGLKHFLPRMPKGAIVIFDQVNFGRWPGETKALLETFDINQLELRQFPWQGLLSYAVI